MTIVDTGLLIGSGSLLALVGWAAFQNHQERQGISRGFIGQVSEGVPGRSDQEVERLQEVLEGLLDVQSEGVSYDGSRLISLGLVKRDAGRLHLTDAGRAIINSDLAEAFQRIDDILRQATKEARLKAVELLKVARDPSTTDSDMAKARAALRALLNTNYEYQRASFWAPAYPKLDIQTAQEVALGKAPVEIAKAGTGLELTRAEAHAWFTDGAPWSRPPFRFWYASKFIPPTGSVSEDLEWTPKDLRGGLVPDVPEKLDVLRWLRAIYERGDWGVLTRLRKEMQEGRSISYRYIDKLDEITPKDLPRGASTGVDAAFKAARARRGDSWFKDFKPISALPSAWTTRLPPQMRLLDTPNAMMTAGEEVHNCLRRGSGHDEFMIGKAKRGESFFFEVKVPGRPEEGLEGCHTTAEVTPEGKVKQHLGPSNSTPTEPCNSIFDDFITSISPLGLHPGYRTEGAEMPGVDLSGYSGRRVGLRQANLDHANLSNASISDSHFDGARLTGANLRGGVFENSNFDQADLSGADLSNVNASHSNFRGANFDHTNLVGADLDRANLTGARNLNRAIFRNKGNAGNAVALPGAVLDDVELEAADLREAKLSSASLRNASLRRVDLRGSTLTSADLSGTDLHGANLTRARLSSANLRGAKLKDTVLDGADLSRATLTDITVENSSANMATFRDAKVRPSVLKRLRYDTLVLPDGSVDYRPWTPPEAPRSTQTSRATPAARKAQTRSRK